MISVRQPQRGDGQSRFTEGSLVRHRRYGYRGVVVAYDLECLADDGWYLKNKTQPERDQPWYHVLVDGTGQMTYAAEESLMPENDPSPIEHPLIAIFFSGFEDGAYVRNERPWEGWG
jgi:heat shock protein HspQ